ncbi:MAG: exodeoxyribonuclease III Xth [Parcubacteria group bacterium Gr01-1014_18]|nr:MAG: exodeoxyribonuclease III Xth [Parcubacteria group bacterium Greene0416_36]TSC81269.1 MAG: exodeoxyribonuclease III Xth [Parcubacteria group bacterium Gr01-1014_18]TSC99291.1 MAG: exodeoxyribonuclease III Xth [Parcubacteria group bacterium Greene1014_20]TSD06872.1 MAG: exodeoxyribonuclease III Xth [Parcubacteria group bacterium Greene0714_2]
MKNISLLSWNVNGIRAVDRKGALEWLRVAEYDIVALQEIKLSDVSQLTDKVKNVPGYHSFWHPCLERKAYSGVAVYTKKEPKSVKTDFGKNSLLSREGRVIEMDFGDFIFLNIYFPNGGSGPERLDFKMRFYAEFLNYIKALDKAGKNIIFCGDVNTAHKPIDLARPKANEEVSGFLPMERAWIDELVSAGFVDTFRLFHSEGERYTWWDQKSRARDRNVGWRIDYFFVNDQMKHKVVSADILPNYMGSDHCPVTLGIK